MLQKDDLQMISNIKVGTMSELRQTDILLSEKSSQEGTTIFENLNGGGRTISQNSVFNNFWGGETVIKPRDKTKSRNFIKKLQR